MNTNAKHLASITAGILSLAGYVSAASLGSEKYTYDASRNIIEKAINEKITKMSFDKSNRLLRKQDPGQITEKISYDDAGRPIAEIAEDGQKLRYMSYGYGDKVLEVQNQGNKTGFYYNAEGQLVGKKISENVSTYTWDGNALAAESALTFTNEVNVTGGVPLLESGNEIMISDYLGNTLASGEKNFINTVYGEGLEAGRFTGKPFVKDLDSYVFINRNFSADAICWSSPDPSGFPDGENIYAYAKGDPLSRFDKYGLETDYFSDYVKSTQVYQANSNTPYSINRPLMSVEVQVKVTWDSSTKPTKSAGSDKLLGLTSGTINDGTGDTYSFSSPNTTVGSSGTWETDESERKAWWASNNCDADATLTIKISPTSSINYTAFKAYSADTHKIEY